jgi:hypothetical protein
MGLPTDDAAAKPACFEGPPVKEECNDLHRKKMATEERAPE